VLSGRAVPAVAQGICKLKRNFDMSRIIRRTLLAVLICAPLASPSAQELSGDNVRSLDGQVQEIKSDVLNIAAELSNLEERLLFPSNTQISLFVSVADNEDFRLDALQVEIDGQLATHHIYSFQELEALQKGGVQRVYTGNIVTGEHQLRITMMGKLNNGSDFSASDSFVFAKDVKPKALGVTLAGPGSGASGIQVGDW
jgi:hypothetical protein